MKIIKNEDGMKVWKTTFWLDKTILVVSPIISLYALFSNLENGEKSNGFLSSAFVIGVIGLALVSFDGDTWILKKLVSKIAYGIACFVCSLFFIGVIIGVVETIIE